MFLDESLAATCARELSDVVTTPVERSSENPSPRDEATTSAAAVAKSADLASRGGQT
ncbi:MAG: hypothetical protein OEW47_01585 [Thermoleophilia bacterium]|nr:hypothetical protein [Thermoleophilia bacterium]